MEIFGSLSFPDTPTEGKDMKRALLVCTRCKSAIFVDSMANNAPKWTGEVGDPPDKRKCINGQDDLNVFKQEHLGHGLIEVELALDCLEEGAEMVPSHSCAYSNS